MHFLIVDDDPAVTKVMARYLQTKRQVTSSLNDSLKVVEWVEHNECDAVILDIGMPNIDGLSLIPLIREKRKNLPIIIFTGLGYDSARMNAALQAGANGYVSKGLSPDEVFLALQRAVKHRKRD